MIINIDLHFYFRRWKGENVSTAEVEGVVSNIAGYRDCVVYGVEVLSSTYSIYYLILRLLFTFHFSNIIFNQVPNSEGRAGMAAIADKDNTLDIASVSEGLQKALPSYARPLFIRKINEVELTGK